MSHAATNWAIQQRGLKPATKIVLWHLCDRHNPDFGCFPTQARLAEDAEMSISSLNEHLAKLEALGLIRRIRCHDHRTKRRQATRYMLGFEEHGPQKPLPEPGDGSSETDGEHHRAPCPDTGDGAISGFWAIPSPENGQSQLQNPETNLVREPLSKPVKEEEDAAARDADFDRFFAELLSALGFEANVALPAWWQGWPARQHVQRWQTDLGLSEDQIIDVATETRRERPNPPDGPKALDRFMERAAQRDAQAATVSGRAGRAKGGRRRQSAPPPSPDELAAFYAAKVNSDAFLPANMISNAMCGEMLKRRLVTMAQLRARGVL